MRQVSLTEVPQELGTGFAAADAKGHATGEERMNAESLQDRLNMPTHSEEQGNVILSAAASPIQTRTGAGRRPKDLDSALGPRRPERAP